MQPGETISAQAAVTGEAESRKLRTRDRRSTSPRPHTGTEIPNKGRRSNVHKIESWSAPTSLFPWRGGGVTRGGEGYPRLKILWSKATQSSNKTLTVHKYSDWRDGGDSEVSQPEICAPNNISRDSQTHTHTHTHTRTQTNVVAIVVHSALTQEVCSNVCVRVWRALK